MDRMLRQGSQGQDVRAVQDVLNYQIRRGEPLKVDGIFGPKTDSRVREFQRVNSLVVDGVVGPVTRKLLFEVSILPVTLMLLPRSLQLQPPQFLPPFQSPNPIVNLRLTPESLALLPSLGEPVNVFKLQLKVPTRSDPDDPQVRSRQAIVELIDQLPINSKFRAFLIDKVPNPVKKISAPEAGFKWGIAPLFNPFDPTGIGVKGNAAFTIQVTGGFRPDVPNIVFGAWGDGRVFLNFETKTGQAKPRVEAEGQIFLGVKGTF